MSVLRAKLIFTFRLSNVLFPLPRTLFCANSLSSLIYTHIPLGHFYPSQDYRLELLCSRRSSSTFPWMPRRPGEVSLLWASCHLLLPIIVVATPYCDHLISCLDCCLDSTCGRHSYFCGMAKIRSFWNTGSSCSCWALGATPDENMQFILSNEEQPWVPPSAAVKTKSTQTISKAVGLLGKSWLCICSESFSQNSTAQYRSAWMERSTYCPLPSFPLFARSLSLSHSLLK